MKFDFEALFESRPGPAPTPTTLPADPAPRRDPSLGNAPLPRVGPSFTAEMTEAPRFSIGNFTGQNHSQDFLQLNRQSIVENQAKPRSINLTEDPTRDRLSKALAEKVSKRPDFSPGILPLRFSNCLFVGDSLDGLAFGVGLAFFDNMDVYIGQFKANQFEGRGFYFSHKGGFVYSEFAGGLAHGNIFWSNYRAECGVGKAECGRLLESSMKTDNQSSLSIRTKSPVFESTRGGPNHGSTLKSQKGMGDAPNQVSEGVVGEGGVTRSPQLTQPGDPNTSLSNVSMIQDINSFDIFGFFEASNAIFRRILEERRGVGRSQHWSFESLLGQLDKKVQDFVKKQLDYSKFICPQKAFLGNMLTGIGSAFLRVGETYHGKFENNQLVKVGLMSYLDGVIEFGCLTHALRGAKATLHGFGKRFYPELEATVIGFFDHDTLNGNFIVEHVSGQYFTYAAFEDDLPRREFFRVDGPVNWKYMWEYLDVFLVAEFGPRYSSQETREVSQNFLLADLVKKSGESASGISHGDKLFHDEILVYFMDRFCGVAVERGMINSRNKLEDFEPFVAVLKGRMLVDTPSASQNLPLEKELEDYFRQFGSKLSTAERQSLVAMRAESVPRNPTVDGKSPDAYPSFSKNGNHFNLSLFESFHDPYGQNGQGSGKGAPSQGSRPTGKTRDSIGSKVDAAADSKDTGKNLDGTADSKNPRREGQDGSASLPKPNEPVKARQSASKTGAPPVPATDPESSPPPAYQISTSPIRLNGLGEFVKPAPGSTQNSTSPLPRPDSLSASQKLVAFKPKTSISAEAGTPLISVSRDNASLRRSNIDIKVASALSRPSQTVATPTMSIADPNKLSFLKMTQLNTADDPAYSVKALSFNANIAQKMGNDVPPGPSSTLFSFLKNNNVELLQPKDFSMVHGLPQASFLRSNFWNSKWEEPKKVVVPPVSPINISINEGLKVSDLASTSRNKPTSRTGLLNEFLVSTPTKNGTQDVLPAQSVPGSQPKLEGISSAKLETSHHFDHHPVQVKANAPPPSAQTSSTPVAQPPKSDNLKAFSSPVEPRESMLILNLSELREQDQLAYQRVVETFGIKDVQPNADAPSFLKITPRTGNNLPKAGFNRDPVRIEEGKSGQEATPLPRNSQEDAEPMILSLSDIYTQNPDFYNKIAQIYDIKPDSKGPSPTTSPTKSPKTGEVRAQAKPPGHTTALLSQAPVDPNLYQNFANTLPRGSHNSPNVFAGMLQTTIPDDSRILPQFPGEVAEQKPRSVSPVNARSSLKPLSQPTDASPKPFAQTQPIKPSGFAPSDTQTVSFAAMSQTKKSKSPISKPAPSDSKQPNYAAQMQVRRKK